MLSKYFASPELSKLLIDRGVVSQFDYWWYYPGDPMDKWDLLQDYQLQENVKRGDDAIKAIHFSDLLLPENAKKIWGDYREYHRKINSGEIIQEEFQLWNGVWWNESIRLYSFIQTEKDWQTWLLDQLKKG